MPSPMCRGTELSLSLEPLEGRTLLAAPWDFAAVGIRFDATGGPAVFLAEGTIAADNSMTGTMTLATDAGGGRPAGVLDWTSYGRGARGAFTFATREGFEPYASQTGTQFIREDGWAVGSFVGRGAGGVARDIAVLTTPGAGTDVETFGAAVLQMARVTAGGVQYLTVDVAAMTFNGVGAVTAFTITYRVLGDDPPIGQNPTVERHVVSRGTGRLVLDGGEVLITSGARGSMLLADLDAADGIVGVAAGQVQSPGSAFDPLPNGRYRGAVITTGPESLAFFGGTPADVRADGTAVLNVVIELFGGPAILGGTEATSVFRVYRQAEWDAGGRTPVASGSWFGFLGLSAGGMLAGDGSGREVRFRTTPDRTLLLEEVRVTGSSSVREELFGAGAGQEPRPGRLEEALAHVDPAGHPIVYLEMHGEGNPAPSQLYSVDLIEEVGGEPVMGEVVTWLVADDNVTFFDIPVFVAGLTASGEVQVWRLQRGNWSYGNLTRLIPGARPITGALAFTRSASDAYGVAEGITQTLAGFDGAGGFVVYRQTIPAMSTGYVAWEFIDVAGQGMDGESLPAMRGALSGWRARWYGAHFAGLDAAGQVWSIWWAPGMERWRADNLSAIAGTPVLVGNVTALSTYWDSFQIAGTTASGDVVAVWWALERPEWSTANLTLGSGGPALTPGSLASNMASADMNIVGADAEGRVRVYWWSTTTGWHIGDLTTSVPPAQAPLGPWRFLGAIDFIAAGETRSVLGHDADEGLARLVWRAPGPDAWVLENVGDLAVPFFT